MEKTRTTPELEKACEDAETPWSEYRTVRQEVIKTSNDIDEGDPMHPFATNVFSKEIKRVQVFDNEKKIYEPDDPKVTGVFPNRKNIISNQVSNSVKNIS